MANLRGFPRLSRNRSQARKTAWNVGPQTGVDGAPETIAASSSVLGTGLAVVLVDGITMVRTRGELVLTLLSTDQVVGGFHGAFGIGVATTAAVGVGVSSIPTPITEETWGGWLYHRFFSIMSNSVLDSGVTSEAGLALPTSGSVRIDVDSKAMRKLEVDQTVYCIVEVIRLGSAASMRFSFNSRILVKLP